MYPSMIAMRRTGVALKTHCASQHGNKLYPECQACQELLEHARKHRADFDVSYFGITVSGTQQRPNTPATNEKPEYLVKLRKEQRRRKVILSQRTPR